MCTNKLLYFDISVWYVRLDKANIRNFTIKEQISQCGKSLMKFDKNLPKLSGIV